MQMKWSTPVTVYQPLQDYLNNRPEASVSLSYKQIEDILGRPLPPTAYGDKKRQWWANTETHSQALAWLRAGRKAKLDVRREEVAFVRADAKKAGFAESPAPPFLDAVSPSALRMLEDLSEEKNISVGQAAAELLNEMARRRRAAILDWFEGKSTFSETSSATLIREDRDAR